MLNRDEQNININIFKKLTYISKLNKNQKEMNILFQVLMKSLKFDFIDDNIKYEEYYFNGLPIPNDIQINDVKSNSFNISWKIDDFNLLNIDKKKLII